MTNGVRLWKLIKVICLSLIIVSIPVGICPKCGTKKIGYALNNPRHQMCPKCGTGLKITKDEKQSTSDGFSPFTAKLYSFDDRSFKKEDQVKGKSKDETEQ